jgi:hypothetical protein
LLLTCFTFALGLPFKDDNKDKHQRQKNIEKKTCQNKTIDDNDFLQLALSLCTLFQNTAFGVTHSQTSFL